MQSRSAPWLGHPQHPDERPDLSSTSPAAYLAGSATFRRTPAPPQAAKSCGPTLRMCFSMPTAAALGMHPRYLWPTHAPCYLFSMRRTSVAESCPCHGHHAARAHSVPRHRSRFQDPPQATTGCDHKPRAGCSHPAMHEPAACAMRIAACPLRVTRGCMGVSRCAGSRARKINKDTPESAVITRRWPPPANIPCA